MLVSDIGDRCDGAVSSSCEGRTKKVAFELWMLCEWAPFFKNGAAKAECYRSKMLQFRNTEKAEPLVIKEPSKWETFQVWEWETVARGLLLDVSECLIEKECTFKLAWKKKKCEPVCQLVDRHALASEMIRPNGAQSSLNGVMSSTFVTLSVRKHFCRQHFSKKLPCSKVIANPEFAQVRCLTAAVEHWWVYLISTSARPWKCARAVRYISVCFQICKEFVVMCIAFFFTSYSISLGMIWGVVSANMQLPISHISNRIRKKKQAVSKQNSWCLEFTCAIS